MPGKLYGTAKIHKMKTNDANKLTFRPIIINVGTASYKLAKHLAKLLAPLATSEYTVSSTKQFIEKFASKNLPKTYKLISFDVASLFTNVPLDFTIEILLKRIYDRKEIVTNIKRAEMKELLLLCTKNVHFCFDGEIYLQCDGVAMGSPLGPVLANIFMVELERTVLPKLSEHMLPWFRYVDDTLSCIKQECIDYVIDQLHSFHPNIKFTYEIENEGKISFLDVQLNRKNDNEQIETTVYRKKTDSDIYLHWNSFAPLKWKRGTLRTLLLRAHIICSNVTHLEKEIAHIHYVFHDLNGYPWWIIHQETNKIRNEMSNVTNSATTTSTENDITTECTLMIPYRGDRGDKLIKSLVNTIKTIDANHKTKLIYTGTKLSSCFNVKDRTVKDHESCLVYKFKCPDCDTSYIGETARRFAERIKDHCGRDHHSHVLTHSLTTGHNVTKEDFTILTKSRQMNNYYMRTTMESLMIKRDKPKLNCQEKSRPLKLFN